MLRPHSRRALVHTLASLGLVTALAMPTIGVADHDRVPDPAPLQTHNKLQSYAMLDKEAITVSGLSSGGFFAHQFHVAYSKLVNGAGIIAGGPYGCVENVPNPYWPWGRLDRASAAVVACTHYFGDRYFGLRPSAPTAGDLMEFTKKARRDGVIDELENLSDDRVWLLHGRMDSVVPAEIVRLVQDLYRALGVGASALRLEEEQANHGLPVATFPQDSRFAKIACGEHKPPFIIECGYDAAERLLRQLYGDTFNGTPVDAHDNGTLIAFDQTEFFDPANARVSLSGVGYAYVPTRCLSEGCRLHVAFHGCRQNADSRNEDRVHDDFIRDAGYNRWAAANNTVVLYPQTTASALNPNACWDFWGYTGLDYYGQKGSQMAAVKAMVDRVLGRSN